MATKLGHEVNDSAALVAEQAAALLAQVRQVAAAAPDGQVLAQAEAAVLAGGRALMRRLLEAALEGESASKKLRRHAGAAGRVKAAGGVDGRC